MRIVVLPVLFACVVGCNQSESTGEAMAKAEKEMASRVRGVDVSKPPPDLPLPDNPPKKVDAQKVAAESAKVTALKVEDVVAGSGAVIEPGKYVSVHYVGVLPDGFMFDTSYNKPDAQPYTFLYDPAHPAVIQGWMEGLKGMKVGGHRRLTIPATLAYGAKPPGGAIPPNAALIFDVILMFVGDTQ
jgi:FKBP-type peptidyl-prolyl cis-trans isomerase